MKDAKTKRLVTMLKDELENCLEYLAEKAYAKSAEYVKVLEASMEDLGLMVNETGLTLEMVKARLRGEDIRTPEWHIQALSNETFDYEEYKNLGDNDGTLRMIGHSLKILGYHKLSSKAYGGIYNNQ
jgi:predicted DNA-binding protein